VAKAEVAWAAEASEGVVSVAEASVVAELGVAV
jgi:hypothetical protein